jgi:hypothetical protein
MFSKSIDVFHGNIYKIAIFGEVDGEKPDFQWTQKKGTHP